MGDSRRRMKKKVWPTRIYDYNYKVSEGYYSPQKDYMDATGIQHRSKYSPPKHQSYAERFASNPWYGNTRGLPYSATSAALNEPLLKASERPKRSSSLIREIRDQEEQDIPLHIRANRRRKKLEEEDQELGIRPTLAKQLNLGLEDLPRLSPRYKNVSDKLRSLDAELVRLAPRRRASLTEGGSYAAQSSGSSSFHSSSYKPETSHGDYSSSKPPFFPRARKISNAEDYSLPPLPRPRVSSVGEQSNFSRSYRRASVTDDDEGATSTNYYASRAGKLREERRMKESREITDNIHKMIEKMRTSKLNPEHGYKTARDISSTLDFHLKEEHKIPSSFVYGVNKKI